MKCGDRVQAPYVLPHPTKRNEYTTEMREGVVVGLSHPNLTKRDFGWRGDMFVEFADGTKAWCAIR